MLKIALKDLKRSGISKSEAEFAGLFTDQDASEVHEDFKPESCLGFPYMNPWTGDLMVYKLNGDKFHFCRVKYYFGSRTPGFIEEKDRYGQPKKSGVFAFFPIVKGMDWVKIGKDVKEPIAFTEGEKKALTACLAGIPTIGLGGVYNFRVERKFLKIFNNIDWKGRDVYIIFDSDAAWNGKIRLAESRLIDDLKNRGATVFVVRIPRSNKKDDAGNEVKVGIDDYIVDHNADALKDLLEDEAHTHKISELDEKVIAMGEDVVLIDQEGKILDMKTGLFLPQKWFTEASDYASETVSVLKLGTNNIAEVSVAKSLLSSRFARRYAKQIFDPTTEGTDINLKTGGVGLNSYKGLRMVKCTLEEVAPFFELVKHIESFNPELEEGLLWKMYCYKVKNPGKLLGIATLTVGEETGTGKSLLGLILHGLFEGYSTVLDIDAIGNKFNAWAVGKLMGIMDEAEGLTDRGIESRVKRFVTDMLILFEPKGKGHREAANFIALYMSSNKLSAASFPEHDRRMNVYHVKARHPDGDAFYKKVWRWLLEEDGPAKLAYAFKYLKHPKNKDGSPWTPPTTAPKSSLKAAMNTLNTTNAEDLARRINKGSKLLIPMGIKAAKDYFSADTLMPKWATQSNEMMGIALGRMPMLDYYTAPQLAMMFPDVMDTLGYKKSGISAHKLFGGQLKQASVETLRNTDGGMLFNVYGKAQMLYIVKNADELSEGLSQDEVDEEIADAALYSEVYGKSGKRKRRS